MKEQTGKEGGMLESNYARALSESFIDVMEGMAFLFAAPASRDDVPAQAGDFLQANIDFVGQLQGRLQMAAPRSLCIELAANMLGIEPGDAEAHRKSGDALKEALNIVCGKFLTASFGMTLVFNLTTPVVKAISPSEAETLKNDPATACFSIDESIVYIGLKLWGAA